MPAAPPPPPSVGAVILSMGTRPSELAAALRSLLAQEGVDLDIVVVGNGWKPDDLPPGVREVWLPQNVGVPEGRNIGARETTGDTIFFFDDDAVLPRRDLVRSLVRVLEENPGVAVVQPRGVDPTGLPSPRRWVPRIRVRAHDAGGPVAVFWEGVHATRRSAFEQVGGWPGLFFYGHEGIDIAWRLIDAGWGVRYEPTLHVHHPATSPTRHSVYYRMNARNRVWVARRNLPAPLVPLYLAVWVCITVARVRDRQALKTWFAGFREGWRTDCGGRRPMRWSTVARLTRLGRPPVL